MDLILGVDLGTSTITALAVEAGTGNVVARATADNQAELTSPEDKARGFSEWDAPKIAAITCTCIRKVADQLSHQVRKVAAIGLTGQQHGVTVIDAGRNPLIPFINWQDRRAEESYPGTDPTFVQQACLRLGADAPSRTGCRLAAGYLACTLFWLNEKGCLPPGTACFLTDYFAAHLTETQPVTDPTNAAGGGVFDVAGGKWDDDLIARLGLARTMFPEVRESGEKFGVLQPGPAEMTGLPAGVPVFVGIGDHQASFLGSVAEPAESVLVNVGTGGQVSAYTDRFHYDPALETRPFPRGGFLLVCAGLCGGRSYALLENFFRQVGTQILGLPGTRAVYGKMNELAEAVPPGADGLQCEPFFTGTRADPLLRGCWKGMSPENFIPGHMARALLEGMARAFRTGHDAIRNHLPRPRPILMGAGNGLRENPLLARLVSREFGLPIRLPSHPEEAAFGAALLAATGAGFFPDLAAAGKLIKTSSLLM